MAGVQRRDENAPGGVTFHTVGCGVRANRSTNRTTPWWFSTPRRPRIDFALTANKVPLAAASTAREQLAGAEKDTERTEATCRQSVPGRAPS